MGEYCTAIVLAAGQGKRMQSKIQKQFLEVQGKPLLYYSLKCFEDTPWMQDVVLVVSEEMISYCKKEIIDKYSFSKIKAIVPGGKERYDSVYQGLLACSPQTQKVFIHDGARPFVTQEILERGLQNSRITGACVVGMPSKDTVKLSDDHNQVTTTPERAHVWIVQTPQIFDYSLILDAHRKIRQGDMKGITDDAMVVEETSGTRIVLSEGSYENIKVTTPEDLDVAEAFLKRRNFLKKLEN